MMNTMDSILQSVHSATQNMGSTSSSSKDEGANFDSMMKDQQSDLSTKDTTTSQSSTDQGNTESTDGTTPTDGTTEPGQGDVIVNQTNVSELDDRQLEMAAALMFQNQVVSYRTVEVTVEQPLVVEGEVKETPEGDGMLELENQMLNLGDQGEAPLMAQQEAEIPLEMSPELMEEEIPVEAQSMVEEMVEQAPQETKPVETQAETTVETTEVEVQETDSVQSSKETSGQEATTEEDTGDSEMELEGDVETPLFRKVEAAPVKVAEPVNTQQPDMEAQIADRLMKAVNAGDQTVTIQLTPENLGTITAQITRTAEGALQILLQASNSEAANLLNSHASNLAAVLQSNGQTVTVEVQHAEESTDAQEQGDPGTNPDEKGGNQQQEQKKEEAISDDFLQQMRLGLTSLMEEI